MADTTKVAKKQSPVDEARYQLQEKINLVSDKILQLKDRLSTVMRLPTVEGEIKDKEILLSPRSALTAHYYDMIYQVDTMLTEIDDIAERIEFE